MKVTTGSFGTADKCYYSFTANNSTFNDTTNYSYKIKATLNYFYQVNVYMLRGTSYTDAADTYRIQAVTDEFEYDAMNGLTLYYLVEGAGDKS